MKKLSFFVVVCIAILSSSLMQSCSKDDWGDDIDDLRKRIEALEKVQSQMNNNISAIQQLISAFEDAEYITDVSLLVQNGTEVGYTIKFKKRAPIVVYHGDAPRIGVKQDTDLSWYWTYNDTWLYDDSNNKILATGITPRLKIENGRWLVSMNNGISWSDIGQATGADGKDGTNGQDGKDGTNGQDGKDGANGNNSFITNLEDNETSYTITFSNGEKITFYKQTPQPEPEPFEDRELTSVDIPDQAFREWLLIMHDSNKDGKLMLSEIINVTYIDVPSKNSYYHIYSLEGIELFQSLSNLKCNDQMISSLDILNLDKLYTFECESNIQLTTVTISNNKTLSYFYIEDNPLLTSVTVSNNIKLSSITIYRNDLLTALNISDNPSLTSLSIQYNKLLQSFSLNNNPLISSLYIYSNSLTSLNISELTNLTSLSCYKNQLSSLTLGELPYLRTIDCENNLLTEIDISKCLAVGSLKATKNTPLSKVYVWNTFDTSNPPSDFKVDAGVTFEIKP